jgi:proteasome lid subunit RPN8/RPN11
VTDREIPGLESALQRDIYAHCFSTMDREVGGVLVGTVKPGSPPVVQASIRAIQADETAAQLTFTQDSWEHIHRVLERDYPSAQIVGWYHTHPGYGLFLSEQDLFIHQNFFQGRGQIALVIDPRALDEAVYAWAGEDVKEYIRRKTSYAAAPAPRAGNPRGAERATGSIPPGRVDTPTGPGSVPGDSTRPNLLQSAAAPSTRLPRVDLPAEPLVLTTWIYLGVIGLSAGTVFWELFVK